VELIHSRTGCFTMLEHPLTRLFFSCVPHEIVCAETFFVGLYVALSADLTSFSIYNISPLIGKREMHYFVTEVALAKANFPCA
jgi:hypothetical protein